MTDKKYPPAFPHDPITEIYEDVFFVHGSIKIGPGMQMNRNMLIVRQGQYLTLINPVRLNTDGLAKLKELGDVKNVIRLGDFHGLDDQFYVDSYNAKFWCQEGQETYKTPRPSKIIDEGTVPPFNNAQFFLFKSAKYPEAAVLLHKHKLLITTDSIQYLSDWSYTTPFTKMVLKLMGFKLGLVIGKPWLKRFTPKGGSLKSDFDQLLELDFDNLVAAHGSPLQGGAKKALFEATKVVFSKNRQENASSQTA